jgi:hypothetical protein
MSKIKIARKDGSPSPYFWSETDGSEPATKTVYKATDTGEVKRMTGVHFDATANRIVKH